MTDIEILENLIKMTRDSANGYHEAARLVQEEPPPLASMFIKRSINREAMLEELRTSLHEIDPTNSTLTTNGTVSGFVHQSFMKFRSLFQDDYKAAITEVDRGETQLVKAFEDAIKEAPPELGLVLFRFHTTILKEEHTLELLRDDIDA